MTDAVGTGGERRTALRVRLMASVMAHRPGASTEALVAEADRLWAWADGGETAPAVRRPPLTLAIETTTVGTGAGVDPAAPARRPWSGDRDADPRRAALLAAISAAAGHPCPTNEDLAAASGYGSGAVVQKTLAKLNQRGVIAIERRPGEATDSPVRRLRIVATDVVTGWTAAAVGAVGGAVGDASLSRRDQVFALLARAADAGDPCPWNATMAAALGIKHVADVAKLIGLLVREGRVRVWRVGATQRWVTIVATGASTAVSLPPKHLGRPPRGTARKEETPCPPANAPSPATGSPAAPPTDSAAAPTTGSSAPACAAAPAAPPSPATGSSGGGSSPSAGSSSSSGGAGTGACAAAKPAPAASAAPPPGRPGFSSPAAAAPRAGIRFSAPAPVPDRLTADERAAIAAAVAEGRVRRVPPAASGLRPRKMDVTGALVDDGDRGPFPDATPEVRAAAIALQRAGYVVVTAPGGGFKVDGVATSAEQLLARAARRAGARIGAGSVAA
jgi:hypothetical protein